jgi:hypothetical protein
MLTQPIFTLPQPLYSFLRNSALGLHLPCTQFDTVNVTSYNLERYNYLHYASPVQCDHSTLITLNNPNNPK